MSTNVLCCAITPRHPGLLLPEHSVPGWPGPVLVLPQLVPAATACTAPTNCVPPPLTVSATTKHPSPSPAPGAHIHIHPEPPITCTACACVCSPATSTAAGASHTIG